MQSEIGDEFLTVVDEACMCIHGLGAMLKGHDDFRVIVNCSSPDGACVNDYMESCQDAQWALVRILHRLGFYVSYKKLVCLGQVIHFLGIDVNTVQSELRLPADKLIKLLDLLRWFINKRKASKKELESLAGVLAHCCKVIHGGHT